MTALENSDRIWFLPQRFWTATKGLPKEEVDRLMEDIFHLSERRDLEALRRYDFIEIGTSYLYRKAA
jgi:hypothetical protein